MKKKAKVNNYKHSIDLSRLEIKNQSREEFRLALEKIQYRGYEVETISDGRKIIVTKPGGKFSFGTIKRDDFMVWVYNPPEDSLWLISHQNILDDLKEKAYKWIWGQEDCDYPPPKYQGREMSMLEINKLKDQLLLEK